MSCPQRRPRFLPAEPEPPRIHVTAEFWRALARVRTDLAAQGSVHRISLAHLGAIGVDRFEVCAELALPNGMLDRRMWLLDRGELEAVCDVLGDSRESAAILTYLRDVGASAG